MENRRYNYSSIIKRKELKWPNGARIALCVYPNIEYFHIDKVIPGEGPQRLPGRARWSTPMYTNSTPRSLRKEKSNWEWLGHGITNNLHMPDYPWKNSKG